MDNQLLKIIKKYRDGKASKEEIDFLHLYYYAGFENDPGILDNKSESEKLTLKSEMEAQIMDRILSGNKNKKGKIVPLPSSSKGWYKVAAAASVILLVASFAIYFLRSASIELVGQKANEKKPLINDIAPGGNRATLTLANGNTIILDSVQNGSLAIQGNTQVIKLNDGKLAYEKEDNSPATIQYNTITTPRGGQYQLTLSDGSQVWLNAASSITFPTSFVGDKREVKITGEAYFEVAHNAAMPFHVLVVPTSAGLKGGDIEVLGTHFNVNAYVDEDAIKTTLLEGSVKVNKGNESLIIAPGEQARIDYSTDKLAIKKNVDIESIIAWKNGLFYFNQSDIRSIMKIVSRWYDLDVIIDDNVPDKKFSGKIYRNVNVSEVIRILETSGIHLNIIGNKILVTK